MPSQAQPVTEIVGTKDRCARLTEAVDNIESDKGFVLYDEETASQYQRFH
jgi:hypothetical protein